MPRTLLAAIFDLDDTLAPDTTTQLLIQIGVDPEPFWARVVARVRDGWDHVLAYMGELVDTAHREGIQLTRQRMAEAGSRAQLMPGAGELIASLKGVVASRGFELESYLISSGLRPVVEALPITRDFTSIWASDYDYDDGGTPRAVKAVVGFTDKTRPLIAISKGITHAQLAADPFAVNARAESFRIPFARILFVGDGLTDIPCFSLVRRGGGESIAVFGPAPQARSRATALLEAGRVAYAAEADFRIRGSGQQALHDALSRICDRNGQPRNAVPSPWER